MVEHLEDIEIIAETESWVAFDKPCGVSVHNNKGDDLVSFAKEKWPEQDKTYPINRLDAGTRGVVLFAKNSGSAKHLQQCFEKREVRKHYLARVQVLKNKPELGEEGLWKWPLTNRAEGRNNPKGYWGKRIPCQTLWRITALHDSESTNSAADLYITLLTGRKHQIRRHCAIVGWPILGDPRYGPKESDTHLIGTLIAKELTFADPDTKEPVTVVSRYCLPPLEA